MSGKNFKWGAALVVLGLGVFPAAATAGDINWGLVLNLAEIGCLGGGIAGGVGGGIVLPVVGAVPGYIAGCIGGAIAGGGGAIVVDLSTPSTPAAPVPGYPFGPVYGTIDRSGTDFGAFEDSLLSGVDSGGDSGGGGGGCNDDLFCAE